MLIYKFDMSPSHSVTVVHLEVTCPDRDLLDRAAWAANQNLIRGSILGSVVGKHGKDTHSLRCVSARKWEETLREYVQLKEGIDNESLSFEGGMECRIETLTDDHIVVVYSIQENRATDWDPATFRQH